MNFIIPLFFPLKKISPEYLVKIKPWFILLFTVSMLPMYYFVLFNNDVIEENIKFGFFVVATPFFMAASILLTYIRNGFGMRLTGRRSFGIFPMEESSKVMTFAITYFSVTIYGTVLIFLVFLLLNSFANGNF